MTGFRIKDFKIDYKIKKSEFKKKVKNPVFVEGLMGVGQVGPLASTHLVEELDVEKIADVYSSHFTEPYKPNKTPGVVYDSDGTVKLNKNEIYYNPPNDIIIYTGFHQGDYCEFFYKHANLLIDFCEEFEVSEVFTMGGLGIGQEKEEPNTRAVLTHQDQESRVNSHADILKGKKDRPGVTGLSGLLIGLAQKNNMGGICLLGETHGAFPDARAAKSVLRTLKNILDFEIDLSGLSEKAQEIEEEKEKFKKKMKSVRRFEEEKEPGDKSYVG